MSQEDAVPMIIALDIARHAAVDGSISPSGSLTIQRAEQELSARKCRIAGKACHWLLGQEREEEHHLVFCKQRQVQKDLNRLCIC